MSTLYHTSYSSLVLNAPAGPEKTLSVLVLFTTNSAQGFRHNSVTSATNTSSKN